LKRWFCPIAARVFNVLEGRKLLAAAKTTGISILELSTVFDNLKRRRGAAADQTIATTVRLLYEYSAHSGGNR
jgi:hypothetical protein